MTPEAKKAVEAAVKAFPAKWTHGVCAFAMISKDKGTERGHSTTGDVCHASLNRCQNDIFVVNAHKSIWQKINPDFLLWVARESPFSHGVVNREADKELFNHASVIDMEEVGNGGALWLCKATRHFVEDVWKPKIWTELREQGLDGFQAFIGSDILTINGSPACGLTHVSLFGYDTPQKLRKNYDEIRGLKKIKTSNAARTGSWGCPVWGDMKGKRVRISDGWGGFTEKIVPQGAKEYAAQLREIFEGDPKNVR